MSHYPYGEKKTINLTTLKKKIQIFSATKQSNHEEAMFEN